MKRGILALIGLMAISSCTTASALEPIQGSITYGGQPRTKLTKAPVGSTFSHSFTDQQGHYVEETYRIAPDRSLQLIDRHIWQDLPGFGRD